MRGTALAASTDGGFLLPELPLSIVKTRLLLLVLVVLVVLVLVIVSRHEGLNRPVVTLNQRLVNATGLLVRLEICSAALGSLTALVGPANHVDAVIERVLHHAHWLLVIIRMIATARLHLRRLLLVVGGSVREECFVDLEQSPLIVHKEIQDVRLILAGEVSDFYTILCELSQSKQTLLKLLGFF